LFLAGLAGPILRSRLQPAGRTAHAAPAECVAGRSGPLVPASWAAWLGHYLDAAAGSKAELPLSSVDEATASSKEPRGSN
ncbi:MAG: hypothetical protein ACUVSJ_13930, partial [Anaerolineae bacterium]